MLVLRRLAVLMLVALWLPATAHCRLEGIGLVFSSACCSDDNHTPVASDSHGCADDSCEVVEGGFTVPAGAVLKVSAPAIATLPPGHFDRTPAPLLVPPPDGGVREATAAPPGQPSSPRLILPGPLAPQAP